MIKKNKVILMSALVFNLHAVSQDSVSIGSSEEGYVCSPIYSYEDYNTPVHQFIAIENTPPALRNRLESNNSVVPREPLYVAYAAEDFATPQMRPKTPNEVSSCSDDSDETGTPVECALMPFSLSAPKVNGSIKFAVPTSGPIDFVQQDSDDLRSDEKINHVQCESVSIFRYTTDGVISAEPLNTNSDEASTFDLNLLVDPGTPSEFYLPYSYDEGNANETSVTLPVARGTLINLSEARAVGDNEIRGSFTNYPNDLPVLHSHSGSSPVDILRSARPNNNSVSIEGLLQQHESRVNDNAFVAVPYDADETESLTLSDVFNAVERQARRARLIELGFSDLLDEEDR